MLRKSAAVLAVVLCLANVNASRADSGPVVSLLMNEPASVFDIGMLRTILELNSLNTHTLKDKPGFSIVFPDYDLDTNRIQLYVIFAKAPPETDEKNFCKFLIEAVRGHGAVLDGKVAGGGPSRFAWNFRHFGFVKKSWGDDYQQKLDQIIEVHASVRKEGSNWPTNCYGPLVSNKIYFEE